MIIPLYSGTEEFKEAMPLVRRTLERLYRKTETDWEVNDVLNSLSREEALLISAPGVGFFVVKEVGSVLDVWVGAAFEGAAIEPLSRYFEDLLEFAKPAGFEVLRFTSARRGWERVAPKIGLVPVSVCTSYEFRGSNGQE